MHFWSAVLIAFLAACGQPSTDDTASTAQAGDADLSLKYQCESGKIIMISYPTDSTAVVAYDDRRIQMKIAISGSGARYTGENLEWWTKGSGEGASGMLLRQLEDGTSGEVIEQGVQVTDTP